MSLLDQFMADEVWPARVTTLLKWRVDSERVGTEMIYGNRTIMEVDWEKKRFVLMDDVFDCPDMVITEEEFFDALAKRVP